MSNPPSFTLLSATDWKDYELVDSGGGQKLERYGAVLLSRPEAEAVWKPALSAKEWDRVQAVFHPAPEENGGHWELRKSIPDRWQVSYRGLKCSLQFSGSRHIGIFPEQAAQWNWTTTQIERAARPLSVLNLFGYTGMASLAAAKAGAKVTHLDASKKVVSWARENQDLSGLSEKPIRWIVDDALKFVQREARRGAQYDGLILDPPKFGRGPKGEVWEFYKLLPNLLSACREVLSPTPSFVVLTAYAVKASALTLHAAMSEMMEGVKGEVTAGEIIIQEKSAGRYLSTAIYANWSAG